MTTTAIVQHRLTPVGMLLRWRLSLAVAGAVLFGMMLRSPMCNAALLFATVGGFLGCAGCSALNQLQEKRLDAAMVRTRQRPLVVGAFKPQNVVVLSSVLFIFSAGLLYRAGNWPAVVTLLVIIGCYNGIYTLLKGRTTFFLIPGAIAGALPPVLGWLCAGGSLANRRCLGLFAVFFVWQIPHFWLLAARHRADYARAGIRWPWRDGSAPERLIQAQWIVAFALMLVWLPGCGIIQSVAGAWIVMSMSALLMIVMMTPGLQRYLFACLNGTMFIALLMALCESMLTMIGRV
jgi:heme o synthase